MSWKKLPTLLLELELRGKREMRRTEKSPERKNAQMHQAITKWTGTT
jgi:hypothetical protein